jgi:hypothetical protein
MVGRTAGRTRERFIVNGLQICVPIGPYHLDELGVPFRCVLCAQNSTLLLRIGINQQQKKDADTFLIA